MSDPALHQEAVDRIVSQTGRAPGDLIPILRAIQDEFHYLPEDALRRVCETTEITPRALAGVSSFYAQFRHRPAGRYRLRVCEGTACHVRGASDIEQAFRHELRIPADDDTDPDRVFTVEKVACLGCCMLAPVAQVQDVTYGTLAPRGIPEVLRDFLAAQNGSTTARSRRRSRTGTYAAEVRTCLCSSCRAAGADGVIEELHRQIDANRLPARVRDVGCTGISYQAPLLEVIVNGGSFRYGAVHPEHVGSILRRHIQPEGRLRQAGQALLNRMEELVEQGPAPDGVVRYAQEIRDETTLRYTGAQCRIATEHAGEVSPLDLDGYLAREGFEALRRCVEEWSPEEIIAQIEASGLRGRGGAGFPTGVKWARVREAAGDRKVVICNGDEGDPGAFMDRMILESFPFRVLEGMAIAAVAVGAEEGIFYVRAEYPLATRRVREAIRLAEEKGFLGDDVLGRKRRLHFRVVEGAGAFVCGEETALLAAVEGRRGMPRIRPPYPAQSGLYGRPTLINNVETLSTISWILRHGPEAFAAHGTKQSTGTKAFALAGKIVRGGLIEVPMGMTLRRIVEEVGGGVPDGKAVKAVQVGGPSGGCVPASLLDTPVDYQALEAVGAIMGSGGMVVMDESDCMVDVARYFLSFTQQESCGKCTPCRVGTRRMLEILDALCEGRATAEDLTQLESLCRTVRGGSLCGLGKTAPNPVMSTLTHFRDEYEAHVQGRCPAGKCKSMIRYRITADCIGCTICAQRCPVDAIPIAPYRLHHINMDLCIRCDTCRQVCPEDAVVVEALERMAPCRD